MSFIHRVPSCLFSRQSNLRCSPAPTDRVRRGYFFPRCCAFLTRVESGLLLSKPCESSSSPVRTVRGYSFAFGRRRIWLDPENLSRGACVERHSPAIYGQSRRFNL